MKEILRKIYNSLFCTFAWKSYQNSLEKVFSEKRAEKNESVYYVISCEKFVQQGLFGYVDLVLSMVHYAMKNGMIPAVDMKNYPNTYLEKDEIGKINAWELFFKSLTSTSLDTIYREKKHVIGNLKDIDWNNRPTIRGVHNQKKHAFWSSMYGRFVQLSPKAEEYCENEYRKLLEGKANHTLGVLIRGTDIKKCKGHAIQPSIEQVIEKVEEVLRSNPSFQYIYLATEEKKNEAEMEKAFPEKIIVNQRTYYDSMDYSHGLSNVSTDRERDRYSRGMEYLSSIRLLSRCGGLVAGQCGGSFAAYYWNNNQYRYTFFWELGTVE